MAQKHLVRVANTIASLNHPDIVHLTEVEGCDALEALIELLERSFGAKAGMYKPYLVAGRDTATGKSSAISSLSLLTYAPADRQLTLGHHFSQGNKLDS